MIYVRIQKLRGMDLVMWLTYHLWCRLESNPGSGDDAELAQAAESAVEEVRVLLGRAGDDISSSCIPCS
jgi:hypothetical protein